MLSAFHILLDLPFSRTSALKIAGRTGYVALITCIGMATTSVQESLGQGLIKTFDPFYLGESASRSFYDTYSVTAEVSYHPVAFLSSDIGSTGSQDSAVPGTSSPLGLNMRLEYHLARQFDLGVYVDATGNTAGRSLDLSWVALKYYQRYENVNYAVRLALDPSSNGGSGFPQMDLGFLYHTLHSPTVASEYAVGIRRIQIGFQQLIQTSPPPLKEGDPIIISPQPDRQLLRSQALGWEVHLKSGYNVVFDPAGSNLYVAFMGEGGSYDVVEWVVDDTVVGGGNRISQKYAGGIIWLRSGIQINRPTYMVSPHVSVPVKQWAASTDLEQTNASAYIGLRFTIR